MKAILDAILDFLESLGGFYRTFIMLFYWFFWTYSENLSLLWEIFGFYIMLLDYWLTSSASAEIGILEITIM